MMKDLGQSSSSAVPGAYTAEVSGSSGRPSEWEKERMEQDKRLRRELATSIDKRRIQSVNAGFQSLITILPPPEQEKMSKVVIDPNAFDDFEVPREPDGESAAPPYNLYIPPRTHGGKRKKSKNRRRHSETIWTIVSEQENHPHFATTTKPSGSKHKTKSKEITSKDKEAADKSFFSSPSKHHHRQEVDKKKKNKKKHSKEHTVSFLDNPIFETELKNWTLPRVELWCRDPQCQINVQLWNDYCQSHQSELTQLQVQELLNQQHQYVHQQQQQQQQQYICDHQHPPPPAPPLPKQHKRYLSDTALPADLPPPSTISRRQRLSTISQIFDDTDGATNSHESHSHQDQHHHHHNAGCSHSFHHQHQQQLQQSEEEEAYYSHQYGNMHINIGASMNNLSGHPPHPHAHHQDSGVGTPSPTSSKNNVIPTAVPQSSGGSSAKTASTTVESSSSSSAMRGGGSHAKSSSRPEDVDVNGGGGGPSTRDNYSGSSSSSSSSGDSSAGDVSSGSTFVTGFDSSESRGSSVPSSLNKPPHPNLKDPSNNSKSKSSTNHHNHRSSKSYADTQTTTVATTAASGYPSVPYIPSGYRKPGICPSCNGLVPPPSSSTNHHLIPVDPILSAAGLGGPADATLGGLPHHHHHHTTSSHQYHHNITSSTANKSDNAFWNFSKFQHPLQRDHSFHSVGGFTLNGQYNTQVKKRCMVKFCSSHKIALVVSSFSLMVTIGLIITLILMKKRGMMDTMDMMPT